MSNDKNAKLAAGISTGIDAGEFSIYYQPKFDPDSEDICSLEALLRWNHPTDGLREAAGFIKAIENSDELVNKVDGWVLENAIREAHEWTGAGYKFGLLNVNLSAWKAGAELVKMVEGALGKTGFPAKKLALECPWRMFATEDAALGVAMKGLDAIGCKVIIGGNPLDDGCLKMVRRSPVCMSTVCMEHLEELSAGGGKKDLAATIKKWQRAGVKIVAVGVENEEQASLSHEVGCRLLQGNRFRSALPGDEISQLLDMLAKAKKAFTLI